MALAYFAGRRITGTASDRSGGTWTNLVAGYIFLETDTGLIFYWTGSAWTAIGGGLTASGTATLTGKTMTAEDNTFRGIHQSQAFRKTGDFSGTSTTSNSGTGMWQGIIAINTSGTGAVSNLQRSSSGVRVRYTTGATTGGIGGQRANSVVTTERSLDPVTIFKFAPQQTTNMRLGMGCTSSTVVSLGGVDPLANLSGVMFFYDSGVSATNIAICQNDGSATSDATTISNIGAISTGVRYFGIRADNTNSKWQYYYGTTYPVAASTWTDINTKIPAATTGLGWAWYAENLASATDTWEMYGIHTEQNG